MMKKLYYFAITSALFAQQLSATENIASPKQFTQLKQFGPPAIINPNIALGFYPENQFDHTSRNTYFSAVNPLDSSMNPFHFSVGYFDNARYESLLFKVRETKTYAILNTNHTNANSYKSGNGDSVNFGYDRFSANIVLGTILDSKNEAKFTFIYDGISDDKQPQHNMDAIQTERYISRFNYRFGEADLSNTLNFDLSYIVLNREADNFSLRTNNAMRMKMEVDRSIFNTEIKHDVDFSAFHNLFGIGYAYDTHIARRFGKAPSAKDFTFNGYRIPDVKVNEFSAFNTLTYVPKTNHKIALGFTYNFNQAKVNKINEVIARQGTQIITAQNIWKNHYGETFNGKVDHHTFSVASKYNFTPSSTQTYTLALESIERIPSNDERFVALNPPNNLAIGQGWASNPNLKPERRNRIKALLTLKDENYLNYMESHFDNNAWQIGALAVMDYANDFIIWDRARGQQGTNPNYKSNNIISRNIDATLYSFGAFANYNFLENFGVKANIYYNYGENRSDDRPLYQIAPLETTLNFDYQNYASFGKYALGSAIRAVASQNRGDFDAKSGLGIDRKMGGFAVVDLYGSLSFKDTFGLRFGVNNIFDKNYSEYISGSHVEAVSPTNIIYAPGRSFYIALHGNF